MLNVARVDVVEAGQLDEVVAGLSGCDILYLDTEFVRERTYFAEFCLLQIAAGSKIWCIDSLSIDDLGALDQIFTRTDVRKVFHAARQDLEVILQRMRLVPQPVFDTQIAAALLGWPEQVAYAALVKELLAVDLDKTVTRTNWRARPLDDKQLNYAADDVRYLAPLREHLHARLEAAGRLAWLEEECERLCDPSTLTVAPSEAWRKVKGSGRMNGPALAAAKALATWREQAAIARNLPRGWVLRDDQLLRLAEGRPPTVAALAADTELHPKFVRRCGAEVVEILNSSAVDGTQAEVQEGRRLGRDEQKRVNQIIETVKSAAALAGIAASLIASRKEVERAVLGGTDVRFLAGWRREVLGETGC
jgi:ribonuclease D